ncbi:P-loop containing nucleoside triphosphate hydrolase protein [Byssothecium circinans]|uniref:P-loop containing nucleoside triphosphate hydrolase protein n=1 Tax=Byssothecium circinans TaxID=147558 RepID=A0A6A5UHM4_9PLEO|nr:P-loop containing nucleoside triphosphate hydrolase protein [Byssothecium circinans]
MPIASLILKPCNTVPDTPPSCESRQAPVFTGLAHSDPITAISLAELFKDIFKAIQATTNIPQDPDHKAAEHQAANNLQPAFKAVDEVWDEKVYRYTIVELAKEELEKSDEYVFVRASANPCTLDRDTKETTYYIDIKSEQLRDVLRTLLENISVISLKEDKLSVEQNLLYNFLPKLELSHYWNNVGPVDYARKEHLGLLIDYIKIAYKATTQHLESLLRSHQITYDLLWALFRPNTMVYTTCPGTHSPRCVKYESGEETKTKSGSKYWKIECRYLDFDGTDFGEMSTELKVPKFQGVRQIDSLPAFPIQYHPNATEVKADLFECGRKFVRLMGTHHHHCKGQAFFMHKGKPVGVPVDSRIMIDAAFFRKMNPNYSKPKASEEDDANPISLFSLLHHSQPQPERVRSTGLEPADLTEDDLLICSPTVPGFSFTDKLWAEFPVRGIKDIQWSSVPSDCLTIPKEQEEAVMALAEARTHRANEFEFDDFVAGKGRGLIVLLHGPPGLGKTLTAEAVAEHLRRPLYSISAGELSNKAGSLEGQLSDIFQIASHWNAILLLDEADVYLERRSSQDLLRNSLVTVFLRKLEYLNGIMFLTTNRVTEFDEAILSRIHLMMRYDELSSYARKQIWGHFLSRSDTSYGPPDILDEELERLVTSKLNGRQIKNVVSTAHALATKEECRMRFTHLSKAVKVSEKFMREFNKTEHIDSVFH